MAERFCVMCGAAFAAPPSSKKITCSQECSRLRKQASHAGKSNVWSDEARQRQKQRGVTDNLKRGTPAAQRSPIAGPFETNQEAKIWWLRHIPSGDRYQIRNLRLFCREHADLFAPDAWHNAYAGLRQVQASLIGSRNRGNARPVSRWKEWTLDAPAQSPEACDDG